MVHYFFLIKQPQKLFQNFIKTEMNINLILIKIFKVNKFTGGKGNALVCSTTECLHKAGVPDKNKSKRHDCL